MPYVASIGTYLPCWGTPLTQVTAADETRSPVPWKAGSIASQTGRSGYAVSNSVWIR